MLPLEPPIFLVFRINAELCQASSIQVCVLCKDFCLIKKMWQHFKNRVNCAMKVLVVPYKEVNKFGEGQRKVSLNVKTRTNE